jgi:hypothetical protein
VADLQKIITSLTDSELRELVALISYKLKGTQETDQGSKWEASVLRATNAHLEHIGGERHIAALRKSRHYPRFKEAVDSLVQFTRSKVGASTVRETEACIVVLVGATVATIKHRNLPLSIKTIIDHLIAIDTVVDSCFPGYGEAGVLSILKRGGTKK